MKNILPLVFYSIFLLVLIGLYPLSIGMHYSETMLLGTFMIALASIVVFIAVKEKDLNLAKQYFKPSYLFLLAFSVGFFQMYIDLLLGNITENEQYIFIQPNLINQGAILSTAGLITFLFGYYCYRRKNKNNKVYDKQPIPMTPMRVFFILVALLYFATNLEALLSGGYSQAMLEARAGTLEGYAEILFMVTLTAFLTIACVNLQLLGEKSFKEYVKYLGIPFHLIIFTFCFLLIFLGDRGPIIIVGLSYIAAFIMLSKKKIGLKLVILGIVAGGSFLTIVATTRALDDNTPWHINVSEATQQFRAGETRCFQSISEPTAELGIVSVRTFHLSLRHINDGGELMYGSFQGRQLLNLIPFSQRLYAPFVDSHFRYRSSAFYITWLAQGEFYSYGSGTSVLADLLLSFGILGVFIGMFLLGMFFRWVDLLACSFSIDKIRYLDVIIVIVVCSLSISWARATYLHVLMHIFFAYLLVMLYRIAVTKKLN